MITASMAGSASSGGGHRVQPLRADRLRRRTPFAPHRVGEHAVAVDLDDRRRVAVPGDGQVGGGQSDGRGDQRDRRSRMLVGAARDDLARSAGTAPDGSG